MHQTSTEEMDFDIIVQPENGHFIAEVVGTPRLRAEGPDRFAATSALIDSLREQMQQGNLFRIKVRPHKVEVSKSPRPVFYDFKPRSIAELAGAFKDDPDLMQICEDIYRERDEEKRREFPE
jgi:hypothetical protein